MYSPSESNPGSLAMYSTIIFIKGNHNVGIGTIRICVLDLNVKLLNLLCCRLFEMVNYTLERGRI